MFACTYSTGLFTYYSICLQLKFLGDLFLEGDELLLLQRWIQYLCFFFSISVIEKRYQAILVTDFNCKIVERRSNSWLVSVVTGVTVAVPYIDTKKERKLKKRKIITDRCRYLYNLQFKGAVSQGCCCLRSILC